MTNKNKKQIFLIKHCEKSFEKSVQLAATLREESERAKREKRTVEDVMENVLKSRRGEKGHAELAQYQAVFGKYFLKSKFFWKYFL